MYGTRVLYGALEASGEKKKNGKNTTARFYGFGPSGELVFCLFYFVLYMYTRGGRLTVKRE